MHAYIHTLPLHIPQHYDIANHFNEWAGGTSDNDTVPVGFPNFNLCPNAQKTEKFCRNYLRYRHHKLPTDSAMNTFMQPLSTFMALSNLYWGLWAVSQAVHEGFEIFPYLRYAIERLREGLKVAESAPAAFCVRVAPPKARYVKSVAVSVDGESSKS